MLDDNERAAQVVRFWRAIEMFSPQDVPRVTTGSGATQRVLDVDADELTPWESGHPVQGQPPKGMTWQFTVYGGLYEISAAQSALVSALGPDSKPADGRGGAGQSAMFAFVLDAEGYLLENSATLSSCAWAISRLESPGPGSSSWLDGLADDEAAFGSALNRLVKPKLKGGAEAGPALAAAGKVVADRVRGAAVHAVAAGAKEAGTVVSVSVGAAVASVTGPAVGGIAGAVAGSFVERLLTPKNGARDANRADGRTAPGGSGVQVPQLRMTARALHGFVASLVHALSLEKALRPAGVRVACTHVPVREDDQVAEQPFLNSLVANDLVKVEEAVRRGDLGRGLRAYLSDDRQVRVNKRVDVRVDRDALVSGVAPVRIPGGRWPTAVGKPLVISQQFAVNQIMRELGDRDGIFAVNGPPGTGKTTMLRDVLAAIVVERARALADLRVATDAFTDVVERVALTDSYTATVRRLRPALTGFEVVVATASNDAAANVTAEIPSVDAVRGAEQAALAADYYPELASQVLGAPAWGMVAAVLGNMKNRSRFGQQFWFGTSPAPDTERGDPQPMPDQAGLGMLNILKRVRAGLIGTPDWIQAVASFREAEAHVQGLVAIRQEAAKTLVEHTRRQAAVAVAEGAAQRARADRASATERLERARQEREQENSALDRADAEYERHVARRPGFWVALSTFFRASKEWYAGSVTLAQQRKDAATRLKEADELVGRCESELKVCDRECQHRDEVLDKARRKFAETVTRVDATCRRWPGTVPFMSDPDDDESFHLVAPWADHELTLARNQLFLEALRLHRAFLFNAEPKVRGNLAVITTALRSGLQLRPETRLAAWQSLFLVVPMISTTFASLPRLFEGLGRESLGWLFIDEAGQATPQQAVGGLWRTRRAVIVGDPQQLEPVVPLPSSAQHVIRNHYRVHEQWTPDITSVQRVADRLARHGTALPEPESESTIWVGAPLRVHRRCDRPIFDISNTIAYGGDLMVYGTANRDEFPGENTWIDVASGQAHGNWIPAEGAALLAILTELVAQGVRTDDVRVISPFRHVVRGCKDAVRDPFGKEFAKNSVGTIHTVQGQESEVIVLVLGGAPRNVRARQWAAEKPNLLNVAASRAKRRLYVIGNRNNWKDLRYFSLLATSLAVR